MSNPNVLCARNLRAFFICIKIWDSYIRFVKTPKLSQTKRVIAFRCASSAMSKTGSLLCARILSVVKHQRQPTLSAFSNPVSKYLSTRNPKPLDPKFRSPAKRASQSSLTFLLKSSSKWSQECFRFHKDKV